MVICFGLIASSFAQYTESYIGEVKLFAGNFAPVGWALCEGQLLAISQNQALFSILGTMYGGNGVSTFGLPDLRATVPVGVGGRSGTPMIVQGEFYGSQTFQLTPVYVKPYDSLKVAVNTVPSGVINMYQPSLGMRYIICLNGIYPSRQ